MTDPICLQGYEYALGPTTCGPAVRPDPRFPRLEEGDEVLCEDCYQAALDEMRDDVEALR